MLYCKQILPGLLCFLLLQTPGYASHGAEDNQLPVLGVRDFLPEGSSNARSEACDMILSDEAQLPAVQSEQSGGLWARLRSLITREQTQEVTIQDLWQKIFTPRVNVGYEIQPSDIFNPQKIKAIREHEIRRIVDEDPSLKGSFKDKRDFLLLTDYEGNHAILFFSDVDKASLLSNETKLFSYQTESTPGDARGEDYFIVGNSYRIPFLVNNRLYAKQSLQDSVIHSLRLPRTQRNRSIPTEEAPWEYPFRVTSVTDGKISYGNEIIVKIWFTNRGRSAMGFAFSLEVSPVERIKQYFLEAAAKDGSMQPYLEQLRDMDLSGLLSSEVGMFKRDRELFVNALDTGSWEAEVTPFWRKGDNRESSSPALLALRYNSYRFNAFIALERPSDYRIVSRMHPGSPSGPLSDLEILTADSADTAPKSVTFVSRDGERLDVTFSRVDRQRFTAYDFRPSEQSGLMSAIKDHSEDVIRHKDRITAAAESLKEEVNKISARTAANGFKDFNDLTQTFDVFEASGAGNPVLSLIGIAQWYQVQTFDGFLPEVQQLLSRLEKSVIQRESTPPSNLTRDLEILYKLDAMLRLRGQRLNQLQMALLGASSRLKQLSGRISEKPAVFINMESEGEELIQDDESTRQIFESLKTSFEVQVRQSAENLQTQSLQLNMANLALMQPVRTVQQLSEQVNKVRVLLSTQSP